MHLNRREFACLSVLAGAGLAAGLPARALARMQSGQTVFEWTPVCNGGMAVIGGGGNSLVIFDREEAVIIDAKNPGLGIILRIEAEMMTRTRPGVLVNTHHHADHTGGNDAFTPDLSVIAQRKALPRIEAQIDKYRESLGRPITWLRETGVSYAETAADALEQQAANASRKKASDYKPGRVVDESEELRHGASVMQLTHVGAGHTDNDLFVHVARRNVLHTGDLVFEGMHPFFDINGGAESVGWEHGLETMHRLCDNDTVVIPGHGKICGPDEIMTQRDYFQRCRDAVQKWINEGRSKDEIIDTEVEEFAHYGFQRGGRTVREGLYLELTAG